MLQKLMLAGACALGCAALASETVAAPVKPGPMKGRTTQKLPIRLQLKPQSVQIKRFKIEARCRNGESLLIDESGFLPTRLSADGHIRDHQIGNTDDVWIRGRLQGRRVRGKIRVTDHLGKVRCNTGWVGFHASRRGS